MSTIVGNVIIRVQNEHPELNLQDHEIARSLSLICGIVIVFLGLIRAGFIVEFIPLVAIASFMTGSAFSIATGQVPSLLGISGVNTRNSAYLVVIDTLKALPKAKLDAAIGLTALFLLYFYRWFCGYMGRKQPERQKMWFFISTLRMAFVIVLYIFISWLINRHVDDPKKARIRILGNVPSGMFDWGVLPKLLF
jgi:sodium-independent sulfate anion transporter 11